MDKSTFRNYRMRYKSLLVLGPTQVLTTVKETRLVLQSLLIILIDEHSRLSRTSGSNPTAADATDKLKALIGKASASTNLSLLAGFRNVDRPILLKLHCMMNPDGLLPLLSMRGSLWSPSGHKEARCIS
jgi:hypothetical protein